MELTTALRESVRYHLYALIPTLLGAGIAGVAIWSGIIHPLANIPAGMGPEAFITGQAFETVSFNIPLAVTGVIIGYIVQRIGRTTLLFKTHSEALIETVDPPTNQPTSTPPTDQASDPDDHATESTTPNPSDDAPSSAPSSPQPSTASDPDSHNARPELARHDDPTPSSSDDTTPST